MTTPELLPGSNYPGQVKMTIPKRLTRFLTTHKRYKVAFGGRGGAKSQSVGDMLLMKARTEGQKIACFREFQNTIDDSVLALLAAEVDRLGIEGFEIQKTALLCRESGGEFRFRGLARNPEGIKSMHGFTIFWYEEAQSLSYESLTKAIPTLRTEDSEHWFTLNPGSSADPVSQRFIVPYWDTLMEEGEYEDDDHLIVWINYDDNPWFPDDLEADRARDYERLPAAEYNHVWLGYFNDEVANAIIRPEWFDAAIDAHKKLGIKPRGMVVCAHDPSDEGPDAKALAIRKGIVVSQVSEMDTGTVNDGCEWALDAAVAAQADLFVWDADGMGIALRDQVARGLRGKRMNYELFRGSESPDNPGQVYQSDSDNSRRKARTNSDAFKNKRAQYYWRLRDRFYRTYLAVEKKEYSDPEGLISLSGDIEGLSKLRAEVCRIPLESNASGVIQVMSKDKMMRTLKLPSPNMADCLAMLMVEPLPEIDLPPQSEVQFDPFDQSMGY